MLQKACDMGLTEHSEIETKNEGQRTQQNQK